MAGRTHGQPGAPVTFGWKAASWADEIRRHLDRLREGAPRWLVGQLGGGVGTPGRSWGRTGLAVRARFCAELGLADPGISWLTARDRVAEVGAVLAMVAGTLARIGGEVYELQRPEIGELREPVPTGTVGSITMPHKRNPERSEHLDTLARLVRAARRRCCWRAWSARTSATAAAGRPSGWRCRRSACSPRRRLRSPSSCWRAWRSTPTAMRAQPRRRTPAASRRWPLLTAPAGQARRAGRAAGTPSRRPARRPADGARRWSTPACSTGRGRRALAPDAGAAGEMVDLVVARARAPAAEGDMAVTLAVALLPSCPRRWSRRPGWPTALGPAGPLLVKRDDLTGFAVAGNKARQLEFLVADARRSGADVLVTGGAPGSNFVPGRGRGRRVRRAGAACWCSPGAPGRRAGAPEPRRRPGPGAPSSALDRRPGPGQRRRARCPVVAASSPPPGAARTWCPGAGRTPVGAVGYRLAVDEVATPSWPGRRPTGGGGDRLRRHPGRAGRRARRAGRPLRSSARR